MHAFLSMCGHLVELSCRFGFRSILAPPLLAQFNFIIISLLVMRCDRSASRHRCRAWLSQIYSGVGAPSVMFAKPTSNKIHGIASNLKYVQILMHFTSYVGRFSLVQIPPVHHKFITIPLVPKKPKIAALYMIKRKRQRNGDS